MTQSRTVSQRAGTLVQMQSAPEPYYAFHPKPLPPNPPLKIDTEIQDLLGRANQELGRLDGVTLLLPDPDMLLYTFIRKEAVLSSQIEGTQSSLSDLLLSEVDSVPGVPIEDITETSNYIAAMDHGLKRIEDGFPVSNRLLKEVHGILLSGFRGGDKSPGEFRKTQNWIGGSCPGDARFVPPPAPEVADAMGSLEKFVHDEPSKTPTLIKIALAHAQFESIHPFLDGNGRVGRLLMTLLLCSDDPPILSRPLLYLSLYLKQNRTAYYDHLQEIRTDGTWESWLKFVLRGIVEVSASTTETTRKIVKLIEEDRRKLEGIGRGSVTALRLHNHVAKVVVTSAASARNALKTSEPPIYNALKKLENAEILRETTGKQRGKIYVYHSYLSLLNEGTETP